MKNVWIVCAAEVRRRLRSRAFLFGLIAGTIGVVAMIRLPSFMSERIAAGQHAVVLQGEAALTARARTLLAGDYTIRAVRTPGPMPAREELARAGATRAFVLSSANGRLGVTIVTVSPREGEAEKVAALLLPLQLELEQHLTPAASARLLSVPVAVRDVSGEFVTPAAAGAARSIAFVLLLVLYLVTVINSQLTLNSVIEEKTNRIAELLVAAIDPIALLYGKIAAGSVLAAIQLLSWLAAAVVAGGWLGGAAPSGAQAHASVSAFADLQAAIHPLLLPGFIFLLIAGLLQYSTVYAAIGSLVSRPEDLGSITSALIVPVVVAFIAAIGAIDAPNSPIAVAASLIPLLSPFVMIVRLATTQPPLWQLVLCAAENVALLAFAGFAAGRLYRVGMLLYGRPPSLAQMWRTVANNSAHRSR